MKLTKEERLSLKKRIDKKIIEIENYLNQLYNFKPETFEEYQSNEEKRWACERACERIAEALVDLAIFLIRIKEIDYNNEDEKAFGVLFKKEIINQKLCIKLQALKGMRDKIAHRYDRVDDSIIFDSINEELEKDTNKFLDIAKNIVNEAKDDN